MSRSAMRSCFTKARYPTEIRAAAVAAVITRREGKTIRPYYCGLCCGYHLTSTPTLADRLDAQERRESEAPKHAAKTGSERFAARVAKWHAKHKESAK